MSHNWLFIKKGLKPISVIQKCLYDKEYFRVVYITSCNSRNLTLFSLSLFTTIESSPLFRMVCLSPLYSPSSGTLCWSSTVYYCAHIQSRNTNMSVILCRLAEFFWGSTAHGFCVNSYMRSSPVNSCEQRCNRDSVGLHICQTSNVYTLLGIHFNDL